MQRQAVMAQSQPHLIQAETGDAEMVDRSSPKPFFQERAKRCSSRHAHTERERISREHDLGDLRRGIEFPFAPKSLRVATVDPAAPESAVGLEPPPDNSVFCKIAVLRVISKLTREDARKGSEFGQAAEGNFHRGRR